MRACNPHAGRGLHSCPRGEYRSQWGEERVLLPLLQHVTRGKPGVFTELGALDGVSLSNTFALERCFGWRGVLIEADPKNFKALAKAGRNASHVFHAAVCSESTGSIPISSSPIFAATSGSVQHMTAEHAARFNLSAVTTNVPCKPLGKFLDAAGFPAADFLSLDVEGAELQVLKNANPAAFKVIMVETDGDNPQKEKMVESLLLEAGFGHTHTLTLGRQKGGGVSAVFVHKSVQQVPYLKHPQATSPDPKALEGRCFDVSGEGSLDKPQVVLSPACERLACTM